VDVPVQHGQPSTDSLPALPYELTRCTRLVGEHDGEVEVGQPDLDVVTRQAAAGVRARSAEAAGQAGEQAAHDQLVSAPPERPEAASAAAYDRPPQGPPMPLEHGSSIGSGTAAGLPGAACETIDGVTHADEAFFRERGFGRTMGFGRRPAVIVVDLMRGFTDPSYPLGSNLDSVVEATTQVLAAARAAAVPVVYTVIWYEEGLGGTGVWALKQEALRSLVRGSETTEIDPRLGRLPEEAVVVKKYASAFFGTDLVSRLNAGAIDTLVMTGCTTSGCVRATAVDAVQYGYRPIVVREAVGDRSRAAHDQSLFDLEQKYADVVSLADVVAHLEGVAAGG
jgi:maleamate amidohydrolase